VKRPSVEWRATHLWVREIPNGKRPNAKETDPNTQFSKLAFDYWRLFEIWRFGVWIFQTAGV
jgi:hypothetical protein